MYDLTMSVATWSRALCLASDELGQPCSQARLPVSPDGRDGAPQTSLLDFVLAYGAISLHA